MWQKQRLLVWALAGVAAAVACNAPLASTPAPASTDAPAAIDAGATAPPASPTPTDLPAYTLPPGWEEYRSESANLLIAHPADWQIIALPSGQLQLRPPGSDAWADIDVITPDNADLWSLAYQPGQPAEEVLSSVFSAAQQDGIFEPIEQLEGRQGAMAAYTQGTFDLLSERLFIGVSDQGERSVLITGHGSADLEWEELVSIYLGMLASITTAN